MGTFSNGTRHATSVAHGLAALVAAVAFGMASAAGCGSSPSDTGNGDAGLGDDGAPGSSSGRQFTGDDGGQNDGSGGCATESKRAEKVPLDMVIGLDTSFSMTFDDKWTNVRSAMKAFVTNPQYADLGIGLQFFPIRKQCSVSDYGTLAVDLALEPMVSAPIGTALDAQMMAGGTPMVPLLQGLTGYLRAHPNPGRKPVIVLATDGVPDDTCVSPVAGETPNTLDNAIAVATQAFTGSPPISIFVIGVGTELSALNGIAAAGGTGAATLVDTGNNAQAAFLAALDNARKTSIPCDFAIPSGSQTDPTETNVAYTPSGMPQQTFAYVGDAGDCTKAPDHGWYFDNPVSPTKIVLCQAACDIVKADDRGQVDVVFGCPRVEAK